MKLRVWTTHVLVPRCHRLPSLILAMWVNNIDGEQYTTPCQGTFLLNLARVRALQRATAPEKLESLKAGAWCVNDDTNNITGSGPRTTRNGIQIRRPQSGLRVSQSR
ncbi:hypothetical protein BKA82DRAFT_4085034, partial [Pisolithus tinctorius]